jgi:hypothetical protein
MCRVVLPVPAANRVLPIGVMPPRVSADAVYAIHAVLNNKSHGPDVDLEPVDPKKFEAW